MVFALTLVLAIIITIHPLVMEVIVCQKTPSNF